MISWLKKIFFVFIIAMAGLWMLTETPWGQRYVKTTIERALRRTGVDVTIEHVDIVLPIFIRLHGICVTDTLHNNTPLFTCQTLTFSPLFVDLPFKRLTLLQARGRGIFLDADAIEKAYAKDTASSEGPPFPFSLTIPFLRLQSIHVKSQRLPNKEGAFDCSLCGRLFLSSDLSQGRA